MDQNPYESPPSAYAAPSRGLYRSIFKRAFIISAIIAVGSYTVAGSIGVKAPDTAYDYKINIFVRDLMFQIHAMSILTTGLLLIAWVLSPRRHNSYESPRRMLRFAFGFAEYILSCGFVTWFFLPMAESFEANIAILLAAMSIGGGLFLYQHATTPKQPTA